MLGVLSREDGAGRGVVVRTRARPGDVLLEETPFAVVARDARGACAGCLAPLTGRRLGCVRCKRVCYCSKSCQRKDWAAHREECDRFALLRPHWPPSTARLLARALLRGRRETPEAVSPAACGPQPASSYQAPCSKTDYPKSFPDANFRLLTELRDHREHHTEAQLEQLAHFATVLHRMFQATEEGKSNFIEDLGTYAVVALLCRLRCNVFSITNDREGDSAVVGSGMYLQAALLNHSCFPNAAVSFDGCTLQLRALVPLEAGDEVTVSYVDAGRPSSEARKDLFNNYYFLCNCVRCAAVAQKPPPVDSRWWRREQVLGGLACPRSSCSGRCTPVRLASDSLSPRVWVCSACDGWEPPDDHASSPSSGWTLLEEWQTRMEEERDRVRVDTDPDSACSSLWARVTARADAGHWLARHVAETAAVAAIERSSWPAAADWSAKCWSAYRLAWASVVIDGDSLPAAVPPVRALPPVGLAAARSARLHDLIGDTKHAREAFAVAVRALSVALGSAHPLVAQLEREWHSLSMHET